MLGRGLSSGVDHGLLRDPDGTITSFDPPGSTRTFPFSINASGAITGYYGSSGQFHGFVYQVTCDQSKAISSAMKETKMAVKRSAGELKGVKQGRG